MADVTTSFAAKDESFAKTVDKLQGRLTGFSGNVESFNSKVSGMASSFAKFAGPIAAVGLAFLGAKSAAQAFMDAIRIGGELNDLASRTGESAGNLAILQRAFENAGSSADAVGSTINKLQRAIVEADQGTQKYKDAFSSLGISMDSFKGKTPTEQLQLVAAAMSKVEDPSKRSALAIDLLGKSGGELIPLLRAMGVELDIARAQLGSYPKALDETVQALDTIGDNFNAISAKGREFATGLLVNLAPALAEITTQISQIDAAGFGMMISDYVMKMAQGIDGALLLSEAIANIKLAITGMTQGEMGKGLELMWVTMKITALNAVNEIIKNFIAGLKTVGGFLVDMLGPNSAAFRLIGSAFQLLGLNFESSMSRAIAKIVQFIPYFGEEAALSLNGAANAANQEANKLKGSMGAMAKEVGAELGRAGAAMPENFAKHKDALNPLFDLTDEFAEQKTLQEAINAKIAQSAGPAAEIAEAANAVSLALGGVPETLQSSVDLSGQLFTNLNNASIAATEVEPAFSLAADSTGKMALDLQTTSAAAGTTGDFIEEANYHTAQMSLNGSNFAANAALAASNIGAAKVDALIVADAFTGMSERMQQGAATVEASLDKMREAHHFGQQTSEEVYKKLRDGGMSMQEANKAASDYMSEQAKMSADMQKTEMQKRLADEKLDRANKRAEEKAAAGNQKAADDIRRRAEETYTKKMEELAPALEKGVETAKKMLEESGKTSGEELKKGADEGGKAMKKAGEDVAKALKDVISPEGKDKEKNFAEQIFNFFKNEFFMDFKTRLPQNALS
jgi:hypothetical protein